MEASKLLIASSFGASVQKRSVRVKGVLWPDVDSLRRAAEEASHLDISSVVGVDRRSLKELGAFADSWAAVSVLEGADYVTRTHAAQLVYLGDLQSDQNLFDVKREEESPAEDAPRVLLSPMLWANLGLPLNEGEDVSRVVMVDLELRSRPPHAAAAIIAPVLTPEVRSVGRSSMPDNPTYTDAGDPVTEALLYYFGTPRALVEGDVFAVNVSAPWPDSRTVGPCGVQIPRLKYFAVVQLRLEGDQGEDDSRKSSAFLVSREKTTVSAKAAHHAFLPRGNVFRRAQLMANDRDCTALSKFQPWMVTDYVPETTIKHTLRQKLARHLRSVLQRRDHISIDKSAADALGRCAILIRGPSASEVQQVVNPVAANYGFNVFEQSWASLGVGVSSGTELRYCRYDDAGMSQTDQLCFVRERLRQMFDEARKYSPCVLHLSSISLSQSSNSSAAQGQSQEAGADIAAALESALSSLVDNDREEDQPVEGDTGDRLVSVIGSTEDLESVGARLRALFTDEIDMEPLGEGEARDLLRHMLREDASSATSTEHSVDVLTSDLATSARGCSTGSAAVAIQKAVSQSYILADARDQENPATPTSAPARDLADAMSSVIRSPRAAEFLRSDFPSELKKALQASKGHGKSKRHLPQIPTVRWEDVGGTGLSLVRRELADSIELPLRHPNEFKNCVRKGLLLYGPPGTGKTLIAKCIATEIGATFLSVKGPELLDMFVGESEKNVRQTFRVARENAPCVLFFDELDSLAPARGRGSDGGGVLDRVVSQFLTELDAIEDDLVFVLGATNRPDLIDPSLLRSGRFDRYIFLGVDSSESSRVSVLRAQLRKCNLDDTVDLQELVRQVPDTFTNADLSGVVMLAQQKSLTRKIEEVEGITEMLGQSGSDLPEDGFTDDQLRPEISQQDLLAAVAETTPSVSQAELRHYEDLRKQYTNGGSVNMNSGVWSGQH